MVFRPVPPKAPSSNETSANCKLYASSAESNALDICRAIASVASETGDALEIASGTGQHIVTFGLAMPNIHWHPSEIDIRRHASIKAYITDSGLTNISAPLMLNATQKGWQAEITPKKLIVVVNLLHLISKVETEILIAEAAKTLLKGGILFLYGPFKRNGELTSEGDKSFDAELRAHDPETGYKDYTWINRTTQTAGLSPQKTISMPANNLALIFRRQ
jgi:hypothetical protein